MLGQCTSAVEISVASNQGFWLLVDDEELYVPFDQFPWFKRATFEQVMLVERPGADHLYWPLLDVDLSLQSIRHPERFPLVSRAE
jgi:hypothetical protein